MAKTSRRHSREDIWFSGGFPRLGITYKQFFFLYHRWDDTRALFPPRIISFLELSRIGAAFWLASLSKREAIDLISRLKEDTERRPISEGLEESLRHFQSARMEEIGEFSAGCSHCGEPWPDDLPLQEVGEDVLLICPSCAAGLSLGIGDH